MKKIISLIFVVIVALGFNTAFADQIRFNSEIPGGADTEIPGGGDTEIPGGNSKGLENPLKIDGDLFTLVESVMKTIVVPIAAVVAVLAVIWSGFMFVQARGNPGELDKAKKNFKYVIIGTALLLGAWTIAAGLRDVVMTILK